MKGRGFHPQAGLVAVSKPELTSAAECCEVCALDACLCSEEVYRGTASQPPLESPCLPEIMF